MIMRVTWGKILPGKWDAYEKLWNEHAAATAEASGLSARWLLRDKADENAGYSISLWKSDADLKTYAALAQSPSVAAMAEYFSGQYVTTITELRGSAISDLSALQISGQE